jgi:hypothetical protein
VLSQPGLFLPTRSKADIDRYAWIRSPCGDYRSALLYLMNEVVFFFRSFNFLGLFFAYPNTSSGNVKTVTVSTNFQDFILAGKTAMRGKPL